MGKNSIGKFVKTNRCGEAVPILLVASEKVMNFFFGKAAKAGLLVAW